VEAKLKNVYFCILNDYNMIRKTCLILSLSLPLILAAQQATFDWSNSCGNPPNTTDTRTCLASGVNGSFVMAGEFLNDASFDDETLNSAGGTDVFIVKYASNGDVLSAEKIGGTDYDFIRDIKMDGLGNVYLLGYFYGTLQLGSNLFTSYGSQDVFLAQMDDVGKVNWAVQIGGSMADYPSGIALEGDNTIALAGYFYDGISIGDTTLEALNSSDIYLARFSTDGDFLGVIQAGGSSSDQVSAVTVDPDGNITITGSFYDDFTLGDTTFTSSDPVGVFVAEFTPSLQLSWAFQLHGSYLNIGVVAAGSTSGDFYLAGSFSEDIFFGLDTISAGEFNQDVFLAKYDGAGNLAWSRHGYSRASDDVTGLGVDENSNVYITGHFLDTLAFDDLILPYTLCCGSREVYIINFTNDGRSWWGQQASGTRTTLHATTVNSEDHVILAGIFTEELSMGPDTLYSLDGYRNFVSGLVGDTYTLLPVLKGKDGFILYPNPANEVAFLKSAERIVQAEVYSLQGILVANQWGEDLQTIPASQLTDGIYLVKATTCSGLSWTRRLVVVR
jgi:hypothetical protein